MRIKILCILIALATVSFSAKSIQTGSHSTKSQTKSNTNKSQQYIKVYTLRRNNNTPIGDVYVKYINDSIFSDLLILNQTDTLYKITKSTLYRKHKIDIKVSPDLFYGYKFLLKNRDSFTISYLQNNGRNVSDDITIEWNYNQNRMELMKNP